MVHGMHLHFASSAAATSIVPLAAGVMTAVLVSESRTLEEETPRHP
jgi:hypothetical protein